MDGLVSSVGTANMDIRSFEQNFEVNLIIYDRNVSRQLGSDFLDDLKGSSEISMHPILQPLFSQSLAGNWHPLPHPPNSPHTTNTVTKRLCNPGDTSILRLSWLISP